MTSRTPPDGAASATFSSPAQTGVDVDLCSKWLCHFIHHEIQTMWTRPHNLRMSSRKSQNVNVIPHIMKCTANAHDDPHTELTSGRRGNNVSPFSSVSLAQVRDIQLLSVNASSLGGTGRHVALTSEPRIDAPCDNLM